MTIYHFIIHHFKTMSPINAKMLTQSPYSTGMCCHSGQAISPTSATRRMLYTKDQNQFLWCCDLWLMVFKSQSNNYSNVFLDLKCVPEIDSERSSWSGYELPNLRIHCILSYCIHTIYTKTNTETCKNLPKFQNFCTSKNGIISYQIS